MIRLLHAPVWVRGVLAGLVFGGLMFVFSRLQSDPPSVGVSLVANLVGGIIFGLGMGVVTARQERKLFRAGDRPLDGDQRLAVNRAFVQGQLPADPALREAAVNLAKSQLRRAASPILVAAMVVAFGGLCTWLAVSGEPWWWLGVAFWIVGGAVMVLGQHRNRQRAHRLLREADTIAAGR